MQEHRRAERHRIRFKMVFDDGQTYSAGYVRDISRTGIFLETASPLPVGSEVRLEPVDQQDALFEVAARVVRVVEADEPIPDAETHPNDGQIGMGLEFLALDGEAGDGIEQMVLRLEEAQSREMKTGSLDPFLGVYVEDAPVGGDGPDAAASTLVGGDAGSTMPRRSAASQGLTGSTLDLEEELDAAALDDLD